MRDAAERRPGSGRAPLDEAFSLAAVPFERGPSGSNPRRLLTERQQRQLASIAARVRLPRRTTIYRERSPAAWVYIVGSGVVKAFGDLPSGRRRVAEFLFRDDVFGLAEDGLYVNTTQTVTTATVHRLRLDVLTATLRRDAELQFQFLCKITHELRELQHRHICQSRRDAAGRVAMFLDMLAKEASHTREDGRIDVPMSRADIADYLGLTPEAVSRATSVLRQRQVVVFEDARTALVCDRRRFNRLVRGA